MAARSPIKEQRDPCGFSSALSSAFSEWLLIFLLFIDAFCLYLVTKLLRSSKLQTPCLLCSRFGYLLGNKKMECYKDWICHAHKLELSSLAFCHVHNKLGDAREMCETCLLSFAKEKSNLELGKFLLNKLRAYLDDGKQILNSSSEDMVDLPLLKKEHEASCISTRPCSCCSEQCSNELYICRLFQNKPIGKDLTFPFISYSVNNQDRLAKTREACHMPLAIYQPGNHGSYLLSQIGYSELKITSESKSEVEFSDDDNESTHACGTEDGNEESISLKSSSSTNHILNNMVELIHHGPLISVPSGSVHMNELHEGDAIDKSFAESSVGLEHGLEDTNQCNNAEVILSPPITYKSICKPAHNEVSTTKELLGTVDFSRMSAKSNFDATKDFDFTGSTSRFGQILSDSDNKPSFSVNAPQTMPSSSENSLIKGSPRVYEDIKKRLSQLSAARWLESPLNDNSNYCSGKDEDCKFSENSSCNGLQNTIKRSYSDLLCMESAEGSVVSEVEGEAAVDRLKKQIEVDRCAMNALYKELEEERNASAVAANQAMVMINRLQEEKAAMQLEALQYLRMIEERNEYEEETVQKLNDQLTEREKEILDLEEELENYRKQFGDHLLTEKSLQQSFDSDDSEYSTTSTPHVLKPRRNKNHLANVLFHDSTWVAQDPIKENVLDIEDEREYISECLNRLEKNLRLFSIADAPRHDEEDDEFDDEIHEMLKNEIHEDICLSVTQQNNPNGNEISLEKDASSPKENPSSEASFSSPTQDEDSPIRGVEIKSRLHSFSSDNNHPKAGKRNDIIALGDEVTHLNARLEALEADRDFLECAINSLKNGKDGLQFVQEIASHLRELRKIGFSLKDRECY